MMLYLVGCSQVFITRSVCYLMTSIAVVYFLCGTVILPREYFKTLKADYQYSRTNTDNVPLLFQMQLSENLKTFSALFIAFS